MNACSVKHEFLLPPPFLHYIIISNYCKSFFLLMLIFFSRFSPFFYFPLQIPPKAGERYADLSDGRPQKEWAEKIPRSSQLHG